jgi:hypothetical protein
MRRGEGRERGRKGKMKGGRKRAGCERQRGSSNLPSERTSLRTLTLLHITNPSHCLSQVQVVSGQSALLERRRALEKQNQEEEDEARRALEAMALERSRGVQVSVRVLFQV